MGTPMLRGLPPIDGEPDDGSLEAMEPLTSESRNLLMPTVIIVVAIVAVAAGFFYVTPESAFSAEPEDTIASEPTIFEDLDRLRELGIIEGDDPVASNRPSLRNAFTNESPDSEASSRPAPRRVSIRSPRDTELDARVNALHAQLDEAKRRLTSVGEVREASRYRTSRPTQQTTAPADPRAVSRAQDESVRRSYGPLTRPGFFAFEGDERHATPRPVSYGALRRSGIATDYNKFLQAMTGSGLYRHNDRRPFYPIPMTDTERDQMGELFDEFDELAPVWVQMGILRP